MEEYLGETVIDTKKTKYANYTEQDWVMFWIEMYGSTDKSWLVDQIARILKGADVIIKIAKWGNGHTEERFFLNDPTAKYLEWVKEMKSGEDGPDTYSYNFG